MVAPPSRIPMRRRRTAAIPKLSKPPRNLVRQKISEHQKISERELKEIENGAKKQGIKYFLKNPRRRIDRGYKYYELKEKLNPRILMPGDIILTKIGKSFVSFGIRKILGSDFSHVTAFHGWKMRGGKMVPMIKDFTRNGPRIRPLDDVRGVGNNLLVLRLKNTTPKQMNAFLYNLDKLAGGYDWMKMVSYGFKYVFKVGDKKLKWMDMKRRFTCVEFVVHAGNPDAEMIKKFKLMPVNPPINVAPKINPEVQTPETFQRAGERGETLDIVGVEAWKRKPFGKWDRGKIKVPRAIPKN